MSRKNSTSMVVLILNLSYQDADPMQLSFASLRLYSMARPATANDSSLPLESAGMDYSYSRGAANLSSPNKDNSQW
jgi:hypothetical protein